MVVEQPIVFNNENNLLLGMIHQPIEACKIGVLVVVGGPQYRVGSHRQFVLLARDLATEGIPVMRFDYHGMGDSDGDLATFEDCESDIKAAIDIFFQKIPSMERLVLWGLCDAASASVFYSANDERVSGLVILNPWVRTEEGEAKTIVKHYYLSRIKNPDLWRKLVSGNFAFKSSFYSLLSLCKKMVYGGIANKSGTNASNLFDSSIPLPDRMKEGLIRFNGRVLLILSGDDLTAEEFRGVVRANLDWQQLLSRTQFTQKNLEKANHTFSSRLWRQQITQWTIEWLKSGNGEARSER